MWNKAIKIELLFGIVFLFLNNQYIFAQNSLYRVVSLDLRQQKIEDVLQLLSKRNNLQFSYSSNFIPKDSVITVTVNNVTVKEALNVILGDKYEYRESYNHIVLKPAPHRLKLMLEEIVENENIFTISGRVIDERTGLAVPLASVYEKRILASTLTNNNGNFRLKIRKKEDDITLTVSKELYKDISMVILPSAVVKPGKNGEYGYNPEYVEGLVERTAFGRILLSSKQKIQSVNLAGFFANKPFQASLTPGLSTHGTFNSQVVNKLSLNLLGGYTSGVDGVEIAGVFNINKGNVRFFQGAGIFNVVGGSMVGAQFAGINNTVMDNATGMEAAGIYNSLKGDLSGVQLAGVMNNSEKNVSYFQAAGVINKVGGNLRGGETAGALNLVKGSVNGIQSAGVGNFAGDDLLGVQMAGVMNNTKGEVTGVQVAGVVNNADEEVNGVQISGLVNRAGKGLKGLQIAGLVNVSNVDTDAWQISGFLNRAKKFKGLQIGIINVADSSSGISLGIVNLGKGRYRSLSISYNEILNTNLTFKSGSSKLYSIVTVGSNFSRNQKAYSIGFGLGHHFILSKRLFISGELLTSTFYLGNWDYLNNLYKGKAILNLQVNRFLSVYAGPTFNFYEKNIKTPEKGYHNVHINEGFKVSESEKFKTWIGFEFGVSLF